MTYYRHKRFLYLKSEVDIIDIRRNKKQQKYKDLYTDS